MAVLTADRYAEICKKVLKRKTAYGNWYPNNCGLYDGKYLWGDCWNFNPKTIIWSEAIGKPICDCYEVGEAAVHERYNKGIAKTGLGDIGGDAIMDMCEGVSGDFSRIEPAELLLIKGHHMGAYLGEWKKNGKVYNGCEYNSFSRLGIDGCFANYTDSDGRRYTYKGGIYLGRWDLHGKLTKYIDYKNGGKSMFTDVDKDAKYYDVYKTLCEMGIMGKDSKGRFKPKKKITRSVLAIVAYRILRECGKI